MVDQSNHKERIGLKKKKKYDEESERADGGRGKKAEGGVETRHFFDRAGP